MSVRWIGGCILACLLLLGLSAVSPARAQCVLYGDIIAVPNPDDPSLGLWRYCLEASWDIDPAHDLSHLDIMLALGECECACEEFPFGAQDSAGISTGADPQGNPCTVYYYAEYNCHGDPSIDVTEPLVKFEPYESEYCEPQPSGTGLFCFYTDWPPIPVPEGNQLLAVKGGQVVCFGEVTGVVPECSCGSTAPQDNTWGAIKARFRE